jgi:FKBP-type peptidyl-prolyl cis-trans isomerase (trigger factor)
MQKITAEITFEVPDGLTKKEIEDILRSIIQQVDNIWIKYVNNEIVWDD